MISDYMVQEWALTARKLGSVRPHRQMHDSAAAAQRVLLPQAVRPDVSKASYHLVSWQLLRAGWVGEQSVAVATAKWSGFVCGECGRGYAFTLISWA